MPQSGGRARRTTILRAAIVCVGLALAWLLVNPARPDRFSLSSRALGQTRHILVHVPRGYEASARSYSLLVLLDGGDQKAHSADKPLYSRSVEVLQRLEDEAFPPVILVGIENRNRVQDMTPVKRPDIYVGGGGALAFMRFIETEVVPFVERRWRVGTMRILYGESYGGLFVLDVLARGSRAFTDYIAVSPAVGVWPDGLADAILRRFPRASPGTGSVQGAGRSAGAPSRPPGGASVFIVYGEHDAPLVRDYAPFFIRTAEGTLPAGFELGHEVLADEGHDPPASLERGLRFVFRNEQRGSGE